MSQPYMSALIVGAGDGLSASLARLFTREGMRVGLAARNIRKLAGLISETGAIAFPCDATQPAEVERLFDMADHGMGAPDVVVYNPSRRLRGPVAQLEPAAVADVLAVTAFGGFLVGQQAARRMVPKGRGAIFFSGASASVKGYAESAPFAMGKFALRGLAQSMARELGPRGIHVAHFVIDGAISGTGHAPSPDKPESQLDADAIAASYLHVLRQPRSTWTWEMDLRPWLERF